MKERTEKKVSAIKDGTVIDHIPAGSLFKVIEILNLNKIDFPMTFGSNLKSNRLGKKGIIKITDKFFADSEINKISLLAPDAMLNIIQNYEVVEKKPVKVPDNIIGLVKCVNPKCITNNENVLQKFEVSTTEGIALKCHYCEKITNQENIVII